MTDTRQHLPPCCHAVHVARKDSPKVRFKSELAKYAVNPKSDAVTRLAAALTDARSALQLDRSASDSAGVAAAVRFNSMDEIQAYIAAVTEYASLVKGFTIAPSSLISDAQPPLTDAALNPVATLAAEGSATPAASLTQPLISPFDAPSAGTGTSTSTASTAAVDMNASRSKCLSFCSWRDVLSNSSAYATNARIELAQSLLASGVHMMNQARLKVDAMLAERLTEINESELKIAYQLFLHAAGVFDACLTSLDITPTGIGAAVTDLSATPLTSTTGNGASSKNSKLTDEQAMEKWRQEQLRAADSLLPSTTTTHGAAPAAAASSGPRAADDFALLSRIPDLASGRFPQLLAWIALVQAQELVILRGISRDFVDYALMAKLSMDIAQRYKECHAFAARHLPCSSSAVADKLQVYCTFKDAYYAAVSCYFQGAASMEKDTAAGCAQAIATFKKASTMIPEANRRKANYDAKLSKDKAEKDRLFVLKTVYVRAEQIIQRDLDIMTRRNDSVYYERIPEPEAPCDPLSLVRAVAFPDVDVHALWFNADVRTCLHPHDPRAATATTATGTTTAGASAATSGAAAAAGSGQTSGPRREGCCDACVIS